VTNSKMLKINNFTFITWFKSSSMVNRVIVDMRSQGGLLLEDLMKIE